MDSFHSEDGKEPSQKDLDLKSTLTMTGKNGKDIHSREKQKHPGESPGLMRRIMNSWNWKTQNVARSLATEEPRDLKLF